MRTLLFCFGLLASLLTTPLLAQQSAWLQIEAQPSLREAIDRARAYATLFPNVEGYQTKTGWYAITLGPMSPEEAAARLLSLRHENLIPRDSFLSDGTDHNQRFWPAGTAASEPAVEPVPAPSAIEETVLQDSPAELAAEPEVVPDVVVPDVVVPEVVVPVVVEPEETVKQARVAEAALESEDKRALQTALHWFGFYDAAIDGSFGAGTRNSMAAWQAANGYEPTGILTTMQRNILVANFQADQAEFGFASVSEPEAGIEITLPLSLVGFDHYEPPFVHFAEKAGSGMSVILISEPGDASNLAGLYDILQTLSVVPPDGERSREETSFTINASSATVQSYAYAEAGRGAVKGFLVVWKPADADRMARILPQLQASFRSLGDKVLDPGLVPMEDAARRGLLAGLEVRKPKLSRSGFYVDQLGTVLTTSEAVADCPRVTLDHDTEASIAAIDPTLGIALLTPATRLSPPAIAAFVSGPGRIGSEIAVAGYSYEDALPAPVLTFGTYEDAVGLNGEPGVARIAAPVLPGDAGGPVLDATGAVLGMVLPAATGARKLPDGVAFAANSATIAALLNGANITPITAIPGGAISPDALSAMGLGMTVLVSCWE